MIALVDTTIWSLALRRNHEDLSAFERESVAELRELIKEGRARIIGFVRQELLSGIRSASKFETIRTALRVFNDEPTETLDYEAAAKANNDCRAKGVSVTAVDILICAVAMSRDWAVFTTDPDFTRYAKVLPLRLHAPHSR
jgi:predicted nucleic acid-binding protein